MNKKTGLVVWLGMKKKGGEAKNVTFSFLNLFPTITDREASRRGYCKNCPFAYHPHPIVFSTGAKLCTSHFLTYYMPKLCVKDLI